MGCVLLLRTSWGGAGSPLGSWAVRPSCLPGMTAGGTHPSQQLPAEADWALALLNCLQSAPCWLVWGLAIELVTLLSWACLPLECLQEGLAAKSLVGRLQQLLLLLLRPCCR